MQVVSTNSSKKIIAMIHKLKEKSKMVRVEPCANIVIHSKKNLLQPT
jgi:hypothetical protein